MSTLHLNQPFTKRVFVILILHAAAFVLAYWLAFVARFEEGVPPRMWILFWVTLVTLVLPIKLLVFYASGHCHGSWRYVTFPDLMVLLAAGTLSTAAILAVSEFLMTGARIPRGVIVIDWTLTLLVLGGMRSVWRLSQYELRPLLERKDRQRALVVGANSRGAALAQQIHANRRLHYSIVGYLDDEPALFGSRFAGAPVIGRPEDAPRLAGSLQAKEVLVVGGTIPGKRLRDLMRRYEKTNLRLRVIPAVDELLASDGEEPVRIRDVDVDDLIGRGTALPNVHGNGETTARRVMVIGGGGYIGSALLPKLLDKGYYVRVLDLMIFGDDPIRNVINHPRLEVRRGDFRHVEQVAEALQGVDSVVHLGAIVGDPACNLDEEVTIEVNLTATRMIAELAKAAGVQRFVFASTCSVYGATEETLDETSVVKPLSLYGLTKLASERVLMSMACERFSPTIVRFATIYGFSGRMRFDLVINLLTAQAKFEGKITVFGGDQWRPFVHVDDAALGVAKILEAPRSLVAGQIFNVGSNEQNYTIQQIGELVREHVVSAELIVNSTDTDRRNYRVSFSKIRDVLGFQPQWTVSRGIQQVLDAIASGEVNDYSDARYSNVKYLKEKQSVVRNNWAQDLIRLIAAE
jgi:nucleoside-diphosphate-sugar epimerase